MELYKWFVISNWYFCVIIDIITVTARIDHPNYNLIFGTGRYTKDEIVSSTHIG